MSEPFTPYQPILDDDLGTCDFCGGDGRWLRNGGCICDICRDALREPEDLGACFERNIARVILGS